MYIIGKDMTMCNECERVLAFTSSAFLPPIISTQKTDFALVLYPLNDEKRPWLVYLRLAGREPDDGPSDPFCA